MTKLLTRKTTILLALGLAAASAMAVQSVWKRYYVGKSALSMESPVSIGSGVTEKVEDKNDWVGQMTDYAVETDTYYLQITVVEGKDKKKADYTKLATVLADTVEVLADDAYTTEFTPSADGLSGAVALVPVKGKTAKVPVKLDSSVVSKLDGQPMIKVDLTRGKGEESSLMKLALIGEGETVYAVFGVGAVQTPDVKKDLEKMIGSLRFKKGL